MIKIRIQNAAYNTDIRFPISEAELSEKLDEIHVLKNREFSQSAFVAEVCLRTRLFPPQLGWGGSSGGLEAALGLRGQPSARLQNSSCVHIKASNERKMPFLAPRARSADVVVWQAEWASTVWRLEGRKGRCESDLGPQPLSMEPPGFK